MVKESDMTVKKTKSNNYGKGFWFEFADGYNGWTLGMSATEKKQEVARHGKLVKWCPA